MQLLNELELHCQKRKAHSTTAEEFRSNWEKVAPNLLKVLQSKDDDIPTESLEFGMSNNHRLIPFCSKHIVL